LGIGDWGLGPIPNPQSPIPNLNNINNYSFNLIYKLSIAYKYIKYYYCKTV